MYYDALGLLTNIYMQEKDFDNALKYHKRMLQLKAEDPALLLRLAQILKEKNLYNEAYAIADTLYTRNNADSNALSMMYELAPKVFPGTLTASYNIDAFKEISPWHFAYIQYAYTKGTNTYVGRVNRAEKYGMTGLQIEADYFRKLKNSSYFYANAGFSNDTIFPSFRVGSEYFHFFDKTLEGSLGFRHLVFDISSVTVYTASIGKYLKNLHVGYRIYTAPINKTYYSTHLISARVFGKYVNFIGGSYIYGLLHDENAWFTNEINKLRSNAFRLEFFRKINPLLSFQVNGTIANEEYVIGLKRNKYSIEFIINRHF